VKIFTFIPLENGLQKQLTQPSYAFHCSLKGMTNYFLLVTYLCSEISKAQDRLTNLVQDIYANNPQHRELLRMIMSTVGRGGEGDVGQRIRDEILVIQVYIGSFSLCFLYIFP
jgi:hypothetical protein